MSTEADRLAALEAEVAQMKQPRDALPTPPGGTQYAKEVEEAQRRAREKRFEENARARRERFEKAQQELPELRPWWRRVRAAEAEVAALEAERGRLDAQIERTGRKAVEIKHERRLTPEAAQLLNELERKGKL